MTLTVPDWDIDHCVLWGANTTRSSLMFHLNLPPLDNVVGDILCLTFSENNERLSPAKNQAWLNTVKNNSDYYDILNYAIDPETEAISSNTILTCLNRFFDLATGTENMCFQAFEFFLAFCKMPEPIAEKQIVNKGFWAGIELPDETKAFIEVVESFNRNNGAFFFDTAKRNKKNISLHCNYEIHGFADLALVSTYLVLKSGKTFTRCDNCGRLFSPSRSGEIYCNRMAPLGEGHQTCKESAKYKKQLQRERSSESGKIYKSVSTMLAARVNFAKNETDENIRRTELFVFREKAKELRQLVKKGYKTESEYIAFLNSYKKRKK